MPKVTPDHAWLVGKVNVVQVVPLVEYAPVVPVVPGTAGMVVPTGSSAQRSISPSNGTVRYNSDTARFEFYQAGAWVNIGVGDGSVTLVSDSTKI